MLAFDPRHLTSWCCAARSEGGSARGRRAERGSPSRSNEVISPEILKMRAALFCIFTYLDTRTLLHAAEVCRDWRFVARHPAVWTRVLLENARVCSKVPVPARCPCPPTQPCCELTFPFPVSGSSRCRLCNPYNTPAPAWPPEMLSGGLLSYSWSTSSQPSSAPRPR